MSSPGTPRELLFVELLGGFGDLLLALPAIHALARAQPQAALRVVTVAPGDELLAVDPAVASVTVVDPADPAFGLAEHLDRWPADLVVSTTMHSGIDRLLRERVPRAVTNLWRRPPVDELIDRRFLRLLAADGLIRPADVDLPIRIALDEDDRAVARQVLPTALDRPLLALPAAGMPVKRWPAERWRKLLARIDRPVVAVPDPAVDVAQLLPGAHLLPRLTLRQLAAVAELAAARGGVAVGADTGPLRLATAAGCPAVGLYGPTLASRYGLSDPSSVSLQGLPGCPVRRPTAITEQECWWSARCPLSSEGPACMADIGVEQVLDALAGVAASQPSAPT